ncbi:hypothetical protein BJ165DRAFT_1480791 [Panaeolus papilionaceus]|nr:hypothetical protein BJ165DRAFT_1480791 [Panaeolus papilionaceus]
MLMCSSNSPEYSGEGMAVRLIRGAIAGGLIIVLVAYGVLSFVVKPIQETALIPVKESRGLAVPVSEIKELEPQTWNFAFTRPLFAGMNATGLDKPDVFQRAVNVTPLWSDANNNQACNRSEAVDEYERGAIFQTIFVTCPFRASQADLNGTFADVFEAELPDMLIEVNYEELQIPANVLSGMWKGSVRVYVGFTNKTQYLTERATAIPLPANSHYLAEVLYDFRKVLKHPVLSAFGMFEDTDTFLSARIEHILPDPLASAQIDPPVYNMSSTKSTFRVYTSFDVSEIRVIEDSRAQSVLGGFSAVGGLWTFIGGVFTMFFGTSLMRIFFGSKSLSIFGIAQQLEKDNIARGFLQEYPHIRQELNLPPSQRGIMTLLQDHMIDVSLFQDVIDSSETTKEKLMTSYDVEELGSTAVTPGTEVPGEILTYRQ